MNSLRASAALLAAVLVASTTAPLPAGCEEPNATGEAPPGASVDPEGSPLPKNAFLRFGSIRFRNAAPAGMVRFAGKDGIVSLLPDKILSFMEWPSGIRRSRLTADHEAVTGMVADSTGLKVIVALADGRISVLDARTAKKAGEIPKTSWVTHGLALSPDGKLLACGGSDGSIHLRRVEGGAEEKTLLLGRARFVAVEWASSGVLAGLDIDGGAAVWPDREKEPVRLPALPGSRALALSPDGLTLWVAGGSHEVGEWSARDGKKASALDAGKGEVRCLAVSPDGLRLAAGNEDGEVRCWELPGRKLLFSVPAHRGISAGLAFAPDSKSLVSVGEDRRVRAWNASSGADLAPHPGHSESVTCLALSPDGKRLATGGADGLVMVWDAETAACLFSFPPAQDPIQAVAWSPDGVSLAMGTGMKLAVCEAAAKAVPRTFEAGAGVVRGVSFLAGKGVLAGGTDTTLRLLDSATGKILAEFPGHAAMVLGVASDGPGLRFASAGADGRAAVWNAADGKPLWLDTVGKSLTCAAFSADGKRLITGGADACVRIWEAGTGKLQLLIRGFDGRVTGVALSPDGSLVAASSIGNSVRVCETAGGAEVALFHGLGGEIRGICWGSGPDTLYSAMFETTAIAWRIPKK